MLSICQEESNCNIINKYYEKIIFSSQSFNKFTKNYIETYTDFSNKLNSLLENFIKTVENKSKHNEIPSLITDSIYKYITKHLQAQVESFEFQAVSMKKIKKKLDWVISQHEIVQKKTYAEFNQSKKDLLSKYSDANKKKKEFFHESERVEDMLVKFIKDKKKAGKADKIQPVLSLIKTKRKSKAENEIREINNIIDPNYHDTTSLEDPNDESFVKQASDNIDLVHSSWRNYNSIIQEINFFEKTYSTSLRMSFDNIKNMIIKLSTNYKERVFEFLLNMKNSLKMVSSGLKVSIAEFDKFDIFKEFNTTLEPILIKDSPLLNMKTESYKIKVLSKYQKPIIEDNMHKDNYDNPSVKLIQNKALDSSELTFCERHELIKILWKCIKQVELNGYVYKSESVVIKEYTIIDKLLSKNESNSETKNKKNTPKTWKRDITDKEINYLYKWLENKSYRIVFLKMLNDWRNYGTFLMEKKDFLIIGNIMIRILEFISKDNDFFSAKSVIILSQTFYYLNDKNKKVYLHSMIKDHKLWKMKTFWNSFLIFSIKNELDFGSLQCNNNSNNELWNGSKEEDITRTGNIAFAKLVAITDNMIHFGVDREQIIEILKPAFEMYRLSDEYIEVIYGVINSKNTFDNTTDGESDEKNVRGVEKNSQSNENELNNSNDNNNKIIF